VGKPRSPNRDAAFNLYKDSNSRLTSVEIAVQLGEKINNINSWKTQDKWKDKVNKVGAPFENQNAIGNYGGAPKLNKNHYIHGFYSKYLPKETYDIMKDTENWDPIDILWQNIHMKFAAIIRAQKIMFVKDHDDLTREIKKTKREFDIKNKGTRDEPDFEALETYDEIEYELQFAWDKQGNFLKAQSVAMGQLTSMIKRYDEMLHTNWDTATEEQKLRVEKLKLNVKTTNEEIQSRRRIAEEKLQLSKDRFEHQKQMDELKNF
jgi:phage terminase small subunit